MTSYIIRKFINLITTLLLVSIISFALSKAVPGDKVEAILMLQGVSSEDNERGNYFNQYEKIYTELGLDQPVFYFSISPSFYPKRFPESWTFREIKAARSLLKKKKSWPKVKSYITALNNLEQSCITRNMGDCTRIISFLYEDTNLNQYDKHLPNDSTGLLVKSTLQSHVNGLKSSTESIYFPRISWNGTSNQYHRWMSKLLAGDFGTSIVDGNPSITKVWSSLKWTLALTFISLFLSLGIGIPIGIFNAKNVGSKIERLLEFILYALYATPVFWMATLFIVFFTSPDFGRWTNIFPNPIFSPESNSGFWDQFINNGKLLILPIICMTLTSLAIIARLTMRSVLSESIQPYVNTLSAKGLNKKNQYGKHIVPNALIPLVTLISSSLPSALAGSLLIEIIFGIPGMGRLMYNSLFYSDWDICFTILLIISVVTSLVLMLTDVIYTRINPKISIL